MFSFNAGNTGRVALMAAALALAGGNVAFAQDAGGAAPVGKTHMHHRGGDPLVYAMMHLKTQLALNTSQQGQWDSAVAQGKAARAQGWTLRKGVKASYDAELAKDQPDFAAVATLADTSRAQGAQLAKSARDAWLSVYANLSPTQKTMVRDALRDHAAQMQEMRAQHNAS